MERRERPEGEARGGGEAGWGRGEGEEAAWERGSGEGLRSCPGWGFGRVGVGSGGARGRGAAGAQAGVREGVRRSLGLGSAEHWGHGSSLASGPCCVPLPFGAGLVIYFRHRGMRKVCVTFGE